VVTLPVLVLDRARRPVTDLAQNQIKVYEGKAEQSIESLTLKPAAPARIGFLVDLSASSKGSLRALKPPNDTVLPGGFLRSGDLAFVTTFTTQTSLLSPLTSDYGQVGKAIDTAFDMQPRGGTALYDAIFWACSQELTERSAHAALIILSDMLDDASHHTREEAIGQAQRSGIVLYPILLGAFPGLPTRGERAANSLAGGTGGLTFTVNKPDVLEQVLGDIRDYLDNTYLAAYRPKSPGPVSVKVRCTRKGVKVIAPDQRY
jgi:VWFA-related protein